MNSNLGSSERVPGGFFSALVDDNAGGTRFMVDPGLTSVSILDYSHTRHVNFEADIYMPEDPGIIQVETLGISINADGTVFYGMQVSAHSARDGLPACLHSPAYCTRRAVHCAWRAD
ncbi:hypothetical protein EON66_03650 [archaeon]|nr:MAG: hypothetical protein EON66_03650 [archaeon]